jgi:hypothetical protein
MFVVQPTAALWFGREWQDKGEPLPDGYKYDSEKNPQWLTLQEIKAIIAPFEAAESSNQAAK